VTDTPFQLAEFEVPAHVAAHGVIDSLVMSGQSIVFVDCHTAQGNKLADTSFVATCQTCTDP
jgi:hypothetical protein